MITSTHTHTFTHSHTQSEEQTVERMLETLRGLEKELKEMSKKYNSLKQQFESTNEVSQ